MFPISSGRLCLEIAALRLVRNVGRSFFSMNIHVSGDFQTDKQGFVMSKGQWGGKAGVRGLCQHGRRTTAKYEWSQTRVPKQRKDYYSALEIAQILEGDSDRESYYSSNDSLDREGEESVVRTGDVDIGAILRSEAQREERAELESEYEASSDTMDTGGESPLRKVRGEQQRLFLASHVVHRGGVAGLEHEAACVAEAEAEDGFHQQVGVEEGEGFGTLMKLHLLPQIINSLKSLCLMVSLGSRKMLMVTYQLTTTVCSSPTISLTIWLQKPTDMLHKL